LNEAKSIDQALAEAFANADHLEAPLDQRLEFYLGESRQLLPDLEAIRSARRPHRHECPHQQPGADVGEVLFDFCMTDSDGKLVELASLIEDFLMAVRRQPRVKPDARSAYACEPR
jgi:hypothetical protein